MNRGEEELIIAGNNQAHLYKAGGNTADIVAAISEADKYSVSYVEEFAHTLEGADIAETCVNIWHWVRNTIPYVEDSTGIQKVQLPGHLYNNRYSHLGGTNAGGDCKSMSLMCSSILRSLGFYDFSYRFITENRSENYHHVYLIVAHTDEETGEPCYIPLDCTLADFAVEVNYAKKKDMQPTAPDYAAVGAVTLPPGWSTLPDGWVLNAAEYPVYPPGNLRRYAHPANEADPSNPEPEPVILPPGWTELPEGWVLNSAEYDIYPPGNLRRYAHPASEYDPFDPNHPAGIDESRYEGDSIWRLQTEELKNNYPLLVPPLIKICQVDIFKEWKHRPIQHQEFQRALREHFDDFITLGSCLIYKYWNDHTLISFTACRGVGAGNFPGVPFPAEYAAKKQTAEEFYTGLKKLGLQDDTIKMLCNLGTFQKYGVGMDYMLYRCYCLHLYGQPFSPQPGVPYWDNTRSYFVPNAVEGGDYQEQLRMSLQILSCFPAQGGVGRPYGEPYWSFGGHVINNGAGDKVVELWAAAHVRPGYVNSDGEIEPGVFANDGGGISWPQQLANLEIYNKWMKGNLVVLPQPRFNPDVALVSGAHIGEGITAAVSTVIGVVTAIIVAVTTVATIIAQLVGAFKKDANGSTVPLPTIDFKWLYQTADGCLIGKCVNANGCSGATTAKMCGGKIVELNPNPNDPKNQPPDPGNFFTGAGSKRKLLIGGGVLMLGAGAVVAMDN